MLSACSTPKSEEPPKQIATEVTRALANQDALAWGELAAPSLLEAMTANEFRRLGDTLGELGELQSASLLQDTQAEGKRVTQHRLVFAQGEARLNLTYDRGRVAGLLYEGEAVDQARQRAMQRAVRTFKVQKFVWLLDEATPNPNGNRFLHGVEAGLGIVVAGLAAQEGEHHVVIDLVVKDPSGRVVYREPGFFEHRFAVSAQGVPWASLYSPLLPPRVGEYDLELTIKDMVGERELVHTERLVVLPSQ